MGEYSPGTECITIVVHAAARYSYAYNNTIEIHDRRSMIEIAIDDQNNYTIDDR